MNLERTESGGWLSNSYLIGDGEGTGILIDGYGVARSSKSCSLLGDEAPEGVPCKVGGSKPSSCSGGRTTRAPTRRRSDSPLTANKPSSAGHKVERET